MASSESGLVFVAVAAVNDVIVVCLATICDTECVDDDRCGLLLLRGGTPRNRPKMGSLVTAIDTACIEARQANVSALERHFERSKRPPRPAS